MRRPTRKCLTYIKTSYSITRALPTEYQKRAKARMSCSTPTCCKNSSSSSLLSVNPGKESMFSTVGYQVRLRLMYTRVCLCFRKREMKWMRKRR